MRRGKRKLQHAIVKVSSCSLLVIMAIAIIISGTMTAITVLTIMIIMSSCSCFVQASFLQASVRSSGAMTKSAAPLAGNQTKAGTPAKSKSAARAARRKALCASLGKHGKAHPSYVAETFRPNKQATSHEQDEEDQEEAEGAR